MTYSSVSLLCLSPLPSLFPASFFLYRPPRAYS
jgi:hypothetical protein